MRSLFITLLLIGAAAANNSYGDEPVAPEPAPVEEAAPAPAPYAETAPVVVAEPVAEEAAPAPAPAVESSGYRFRRQALPATAESSQDNSQPLSLSPPSSSTTSGSGTANTYGDEAVVPQDAGIVASAPDTQSITETPVTEQPVAQVDQGYVAAVQQPAVDTQSAAGYRLRRDFVVERSYRPIRRFVRIAHPAKMRRRRFFIRPETLRAARMMRMRKMRRMRMH